MVCEGMMQASGGEMVPPSDNVVKFEPPEVDPPESQRSPEIPDSSPTSMDQIWINSDPQYTIIKSEPDTNAVSVIHKNESVITSSASKSIGSRRKHHSLPKLKLHLPTPAVNNNVDCVRINKTESNAIESEPLEKQSESTTDYSKYNKHNILESLPNESIKSWLQRITAIQNEIMAKQIDMQAKNHNENTKKSKTIPIPALQPITSQNLNVPTSVITTSHNVVPSHNNVTSHNMNAPIAQNVTPSKILNYRDLPYMGEMTLDNCKPRRGRKPKKADICHLIYKNYGTIVPGSPQSIPEKKTAPDETNNDTLNVRTDIQNRIISSLLERRLTREKNTATSQVSQDRPLNLCIRDMTHLKIIPQITEDTPESNETSENSDNDIEFVEEIKPSVIQKTPESSKNGDEVGPAGYVFWPNAGVFVHPVALQNQILYYQKMAANNSYVLPSPPSSADSKVTESPVSDTGKNKRSHEKTNSTKKTNASNENTGPIGNYVNLEGILASNFGKILSGQSSGNLGGHIEVLSNSDRNSDSRSSNSKEESLLGSHLTNVSENVLTKSMESFSKPIRNLSANHTSNSGVSPVKRKRSAIFIPPIPTENQTNPATEVSICKFKFTGGAKPSLQEKKMLSVDSGGNFRYYSGTGDKSMRGYEFFPRETLQQQAGSGASSSGAFLNASGEKLPLPPDVKPDLLLNLDVSSNSGSPGMTGLPIVSSSQREQKYKKRKTRKSLQREKLEQTFKEKGFLIQTQQLESAEGATYCKFRQLRKFTRYLFRSWKDYLPGNVKELQGEIPENPVTDEMQLENELLTKDESNEEKI